MLKLCVTRDDKLDDIIITEDTSLELKLVDCNKEINIDVMNNMCLEVFELDVNTNNKINYNLRENSRVIVNKLARDNSDITTVNLDGENASIKYYSSIMNYKDNEYRFKTIQNKDNTESIVVNHCINFTKSTFKFLVDSKINKKMHNCYSMQDNKIIDLGNGHNYITPNLLVDSEDIEAEHSAYIGKFKNDVIFYLMSRGISKDSAEHLLTRGFLLHNMILTGGEETDFNSFIDNNYNN